MFSRSIRAGFSWKYVEIRVYSLCIPAGNKINASCDLVNRLRPSASVGLLRWLLSKYTSA